MNNKINIAELLKDCPKGMELESPVLIGKISFNRIIKFERYPIEIKVDDDTYCLTKYGQHINVDSFGCLIYPKGKTTWDGFVPPCKFKEGDIVYTKAGSLAIIGGDVNRSFYPICRLFSGRLLTDFVLAEPERFASEEEKQKLFQAIKDNGYRWNADTKTLEKEEKKDKFDITTLKPFSRVLVRIADSYQWHAAWFSHIDERQEFCWRYVTVSGKSYAQIIPFEDNEHLLGTINDCDEYYKTWKDETDE